VAGAITILTTPAKESFELALNGSGIIPSKIQSKSRPGVAIRPTLGIAFVAKSIVSTALLL
jgi:hypothetical protein